MRTAGENVASAGRPSRWRRPLPLAAGVVLVGAIAATVWQVQRSSTPALTQQDVTRSAEVAVKKAADEAASAPARAALIYRRILPSIVTRNFLQLSLLKKGMVIRLVLLSKYRLGLQ